jgi:hypothetical protein
MPMVSETTKRKVFCLAIICLVVGMASSAYAVPPGQLVRNLGPGQVFAGQCCASWNETVSIQEPAKIAPVVVTWSTDFFLQSGMYIVVGLSLNNGPCQFFGPSGFQEPLSVDNESDSRAFQWVVLPIDGLQSGTNTFTICGGGLFSDTENITIGFNTLQVRFSK